MNNAINYGAGVHKEELKHESFNSLTIQHHQACTPHSIAQQQTISPTDPLVSALGADKKHSKKAATMNTPQNQLGTIAYLLDALKENTTSIAAIADKDHQSVAAPFALYVAGELLEIQRDGLLSSLKAAYDEHLHWCTHLTFDDLRDGVTEQSKLSVLNKLMGDAVEYFRGL